MSLALLIFQMIRMCNERFAIPELLFHPSDVGVNEMGISEAVVHVISLAPESCYLFVADIVHLIIISSTLLL